MEFFDSHSHYNDESFENDRDELINKTLEENITRMMCIGYDVEKSIKAIEIAEKHDFIYASCGISPNDIEDFSQENLQRIEEMARNSKVVAIGEIGLDYHWNKENKEAQEDQAAEVMDYFAETLYDAAIWILRQENLRLPAGGGNEFQA